MNSAIILTAENGDELAVAAGEIAFVENPHGAIAGTACSIVTLRNGGKLRLLTTFGETVERWRSATDTGKDAEK